MNYKTQQPNVSLSHVMSGSNWAALVVLSILWGGSFFLIEIALTALPPLTIVLARVTLAAVALWSIVLIRGSSVPKSLKSWGSFLVMGLLNNIFPFSLIVWGQTHISAGLASILNATTPLFTVVVAGLLLHDEKPTANKWIGVAIGFAGIVIMIGPSTLHGIGVNVLAQFAVLGAALSYAFAGAYGRRYLPSGIDSIIMAAGQVTASALVLFPIVFFTEARHGYVLPGVEVIVALITLAIFSTALAYMLYFRILASAGAVNLSLVTFLIPISAILLGTMLLGETLQLPHIIGMSIVAAGLLAIDGRIWSLIYSRRNYTQ